MEPTATETSPQAPWLQEPPRWRSAPKISSLPGLSPLWRLCLHCGRSQRPEGSGHRWPEIHSNSHGIHIVLATQVQDRSQIPKPAKNSTKATPTSFACKGEAISHPVHLHRQKEPWGLDLKGPLQCHKFYGMKGEWQKLSELEERWGGFFPSPDVHTMPVTK